MSDPFEILTARFGDEPVPRAQRHALQKRLRRAFRSKCAPGHGFPLVEGMELPNDGR